MSPTDRETGDLTGEEVLLAIEEIKRLKAQYFRFVDTKQWDMLRGLFTEQCQLRFESRLAGEVKITVYRTPAEFVSNAANVFDGVVSVHQGYLPEITITEPTMASGIWAMADLILRPEGTDMPSFKGYGYYHEDYQRIDGRWRISSLSLSRLLEVRVAQRAPDVTSQGVCDCAPDR